jgi:hypothetical protein
MWLHYYKKKESQKIIARIKNTIANKYNTEEEEDKITPTLLLRTIIIIIKNPLIKFK